MSYEAHQYIYLLTSFSLYMFIICQNGCVVALGRFFFGSAKKSGAFSAE
jgi:hypothetical protein